MRFRYAIYCSGKASRIIKFYKLHSLEKYPLSFVFYDGNDSETISLLGDIFGAKLILKSGGFTLSLGDELLELLIKNEVEYLFCFGVGILKGKILDIFENKIINFHPSLLPSFPGLNSIDRALDSSVQLLGCTAHFIDNTIDGGPIIMQSCISRSSYTRYDDVLDLQLHMLERIWYNLENFGFRQVSGKVFQSNVVNSIYHSL